MLTQPGHLGELPGSVWSSYYEFCLPLLPLTSLQGTVPATSELRGLRSTCCSLSPPIGQPVQAKAAWYPLRSKVKEGCVVAVLI